MCLFFLVSSQSEDVIFQKEREGGRTREIGEGEWKRERKVKDEESEKRKRKGREQKSSQRGSGGKRLTLSGGAGTESHAVLIDQSCCAQHFARRGSSIT